MSDSTHTHSMKAHKALKHKEVFQGPRVSVVSPASSTDVSDATDKQDKAVRVCGVHGCLYRTSNTGHMNRHR